MHYSIRSITVRVAPLADDVVSLRMPFSFLFFSWQCIRLEVDLSLILWCGTKQVGLASVELSKTADGRMLRTTKIQFHFL